jgi:hypothetical protein
LEKIKHGFKTLAECGGIRGVDDTSSLKIENFYGRNQDTTESSVTSIYFERVELMFIGDVYSCETLQNFNSFFLEYTCMAVLNLAVN